MIIRSPPRPAAAPLLPTAKYCPPALVFQRQAPRASGARVTEKIQRYSSELIRLRSSRPKSSDKEAVWLASMTLASGCRPKNQAGNITLANLDLVERGGKL